MDCIVLALIRPIHFDHSLTLSDSNRATLMNSALCPIAQMRENQRKKRNGDQPVDIRMHESRMKRGRAEQSNSH